jgi:tetratricopeptide (TPR) repeat protein
VVHNNLGAALAGKDQTDEAISHYQEAIRLDPNGFAAYNNLGLALWTKGNLDEAISQFREAIRVDPKASAEAHNSLGLALWTKGRQDEAISCYQEAIRLDPNGLASAHINLGSALQGKGRLDEAINHYQKATLDPKKSAMAHNCLGVALSAKGRPDEAISHYQESIRLNPKGSSIAHLNLGAVLRRKGRLDEAIGHYQQGLQHESNATAARRAYHSCLYAAACAAVRKSVGQRSQETQPGEQERVGPRRQALDWLRADLEQRTLLLKDSKSVDLQALSGWSLYGWQTDPALAGVRDEAALAKLPDAERVQWQRLWMDVAALLAIDPLDQGLAHAARREWDKAVGYYKRVLERDAPDGGHFWFEYAAVLLLSGDQKGYEKACAHMVERYGKSPGLRAYHVVRACTLASDAVADPSLPDRLAGAELKGNRQFWALTEHGALLYRAGQFQQSVGLFERSLRADPKPGKAVVNWLWLALANQHLGESEEARRWLDKATEWLDQYREGMPAGAEEESGLHLHNWLEAHVLRREAEALIRATDP